MGIYAGNWLYKFCAKVYKVSEKKSFDVRKSKALRLFLAQNNFKESSKRGIRGRRLPGFLFSFLNKLYDLGKLYKFVEIKKIYWNK